MLVVVRCVVRMHAASSCSTCIYVGVAMRARLEPLVHELHAAGCATHACPCHVELKLDGCSMRANTVHMRVRQ